MANNQVSPEQDGTEKRHGATGQKSVFEVTSISKVEPPTGRKGEWYRYVVENRHSTIYGSCPGSRRQVQAHAERFAKQLNERHNGTPVSSWSNGRNRI